MSGHRSRLNQFRCQTSKSSKVSSLSECAVYEGKAFGTFYNDEMPANDSVYVLIKPQPESDVFLGVRRLALQDGNVDLMLWEDVSFTGEGTELESHNTHRGSTAEPTAAFYKDPTGIDISEATAIEHMKVFNVQSQPRSRVPQTAEGTSWILGPYNYVLELKNNTASAIGFSMMYVWFELKAVAV